MEKYKGKDNHFKKKAGIFTTNRDFRLTGIAVYGYD